MAWNVQAPWAPISRAARGVPELVSASIRALLRRRFRTRGPCRRSSTAALGPPRDWELPSTSTVVEWGAAWLRPAARRIPRLPSVGTERRSGPGHDQGRFLLRSPAITGRLGRRLHLRPADPTATAPTLTSTSLTTTTTATLLSPAFLSATWATLSTTALLLALLRMSGAVPWPARLVAVSRSTRLRPVSGFQHGGVARRGGGDGNHRPSRLRA